MNILHFNHILREMVTDERMSAGNPGPIQLSFLHALQGDQRQSVSLPHLSTLCL